MRPRDLGGLDRALSWDRYEILQAALAAVEDGLPPGHPLAPLLDETRWQLSALRAELTAARMKR